MLSVATAWRIEDSNNRQQTDAARRPSCSKAEKTIGVRKVATGMVQALNTADVDRVRTERKDNWNRLGRGLGGNG